MGIISTMYGNHVVTIEKYGDNGKVVVCQNGFQVVIMANIEEAHNYINKNDLILEAA